MALFPESSQEKDFCFKALKVTLIKRLLKKFVANLDVSKLRLKHNSSHLYIYSFSIVYILQQWNTLHEFWQRLAVVHCTTRAVCLDQIFILKLGQTQWVDFTILFKICATHVPCKLFTHFLHWWKGDSKLSNAIK